MADVKWIKICTDIFNDEKILLIESLPEADSIIVIWFKLLCLAGKQNNSGVFMLNDKLAYTDEMLATIFRKPINTVRLALNTFESFGMIERIDNVITIPNWEKHQSLDKLEMAREQTRKRVAKHREKQKSLAENNVTLHVTQSNADRIEEDKDIDKDKEIDNIFNIPELDQVFYDWLQYKKQKGQTYKEKGLTALINKIKKQLETTPVASIVEDIENCMANNYQGIFFKQTKEVNTNPFS